jgi:uncharacterized protein involved in exopolysaccharide biosynthesis
MVRELGKAERHREAELEFVEPLVSFDEQQEEGKHREKSAARLRLLWGKRTFLGRMAVAGLVFATATAFLIPNSYTSTTLLMPPDQGSEQGMAMLAALSGKAGGALTQLGGELLGLRTTGDLFMGILQSRTVEDEVIAKFDLRKVYGDRDWEDARKDLSKRTSVSQDRKSEIISISVSDRNRQRAAAMASEYVAELNRTVTNLNTSSAHRERVFLETRLGQVDQSLESAEKRFSGFASKNTAIDIQEQGKAMIEAGASLEGQLIAAKTELEGLRQIFTDNNVRVREAEARVEEIQRQLQKIGGGNAGSATDKGPDNATDTGGNLLYPPIRQLPVLGVTYADLYRQVKVQEAIFQALTQQYELAKVEEAKETPSVKVLDPADVPERKSFPPRLLIIFGGALLFVVLGIAWIIWHEAWESSDPTDPRRVLAREMWGDIRASLGRVSANGHSSTGQESEREASNKNNELR